MAKMIYAHMNYAAAPEKKLTENEDRVYGDESPDEKCLCDMETFFMNTNNAPEKKENIHAPSRDVTRNYYDAGGIVTLDIIRAKLTPEQYEGFLLGQIIKYAARMNFKGQRVGDATKLAEYSRWLDFHYREGK